MNIIHRDIKPENVLILNEADKTSGILIAKLLDFGLSKHAGLGSMAKTFVGTPCYLAPEVEFTAKGLGGTYGTPADCWGLGAVLYVMLVARFPEFDRSNNTMTLRLPEALWATKSESVKSLIKSLMTYDPEKRMTARKALQHPWLGPYAETEDSLTTLFPTDIYRKNSQHFKYCKMSDDPIEEEDNYDYEDDDNDYIDIEDDYQPVHQTNPIPPPLSEIQNNAPTYSNVNSQKKMISNGVAAPSSTFKFDPNAYVTTTFGSNSIQQQKISPTSRIYDNSKGILVSPYVPVDTMSNAVVIIPKKPLTADQLQLSSLLTLQT